MTDVSDGLVADLGHIAAASGVRIDLRADAIDVPAKLREVGAALNVDPLVWVLTGGDDYALVATFPRRHGPARSVARSSARSPRATACGSTGVAGRSAATSTSADAERLTGRGQDGTVSPILSFRRSTS